MILRFVSIAALIAVAAPATAGVIGRITPAEPLTAARIARLPVAARPVWPAYLERSAAALRADKAALSAERGPGRPVPPAPPEAKGSETGVRLNRDVAWYASAEARAIADNIVSFQTPAGGWGKNQDRTGPTRVPGQMYTADDGRAGAFAAQDGVTDWSFVGTIDNDATTGEMRFLALVQQGVPGRDGDAWRTAFRKGLRYLLQAQYPSGGWPQVYPLQGGYHDAMTLNDDAMLNVVRLLQDIAGGRGAFGFAAPADRAAAGAGAALAVKALLDTQVVSEGRRTVWAQQYDAIDQRPVAARNFEPVALASAESAAVLRFLMAQPAGDPRMRQAIEDGVAWFRSHALNNVAWGATGVPSEGRRLITKPGAPPLWARFYDPATGRPIFGDRDRTIHDDVGEISLERRNGYSWFNGSGTSVIAQHDRASSRSR